MIRRILVICSLVVLLPAAFVLADPQTGPDFLTKVETAVLAGKLNAEEALLYKFYYMFEPAKLPAEYRPATFSPLKCGTAIVWEYTRTRDELSPATLRIIEQYLAPAASDKDPAAIHISASGIFRLTYFTTGINAVPSLDVDPPNGVPDFVEKCASYMDYSWDQEITVLGFTAPPLNPYYSVSFEAMANIYGYTQPTGPTSTVIVLHNTFLGFPPNDDPEGDQWGAAKVTCAHEFKHASQRAQSYWSEGGWVELDATWMEDIVYDVVNDYLWYLPGQSPIAQPTVPLDSPTGSYEDCVWQHWMTESVGISMIQDFWAWRHNHPDPPNTVMDSYEQILNDYGMTLVDGWAEFAAWNYSCGGRSIAGLGYGEADRYPTGPLATQFLNFPGSYSGAVAHLAANFIRAANFNGDPGDLLHVDFNGADGSDLRLTAVIWNNNGTGQFEIIPLDDNNDVNYEISVPVADIWQCGLVISNGAKSGTPQGYTIDVDVAPYTPQPALSVDVTSVVMTLAPNQIDTQPMQLTNEGEPGSVLNYTIEITDTPPAIPAKSVAARHRSGSTVRRDDYEFVDEPIAVSKVYPGDCVLGNSSGAFGTYGSYWTGNESYAYFLRPTDYSCSCSPGFNVRAVHMLLDLQATSSPTMRAHLAHATGGGGCFAPGDIIDSSDPFTASGTGFTDVEIPCDFTCRLMDAEYFLIVEFLDADGPVGVPFDNTGQDCYNYNDKGSGWVDLVVDEGFFGDIIIRADVDCCSEFPPEVTVDVPNGGEIWGIGDSHDITWLALSIDDVKIELSRNSGGSWEMVVDSTPNDGSFTWTVIGPQSNECLVRISSLDESVTDTSNAAFTIYQPVNWVTVDPAAGSVNQGETAVIDIIFDATDLFQDTYNGYIVIDHDADGSPYVIPVTLIVNNPNSVDDTPLAFRLQGNFPNPFNPQTTIAFTLPAAGPVKLDVLDLRGRLVRTVWRGELPAGPQQIRWDGRDGQGRMVAAGTYLVRLQANEQTASSKMVLAK